MEDSTNWLGWAVLLVLIFCIPVMATLLWNGFNSSRGEAYTKMRMQGPFVPAHEDAMSSIAGRAEIASIEWLALSDAGAYMACWQRSAAALRSRAGMQDWELQMQGIRTPLAATHVRSLHSAEFTDALPGGAEGHYVVVQFRTKFANKDSAMEVVTLQYEVDGVWRVVGYFIR